MPLGFLKNGYAKNETLDQVTYDSLLCVHLAEYSFIV